MSEKAQADKQSVEQARLYVQAFRAFDLIVTEEATRTQWSFRDEDGKKTSRTYSDYLGLTMASFTIWEGPPSIPATQLELKKAAIAFVAAVDRGLMNGYVKQGQGLVAKWEAAERERQGLKLKLADLEKKLHDCHDRTVGLETENQKLRERNPVFGIAQGSVDDVDESPDDGKEDKE